jgi:4-carboxymuconolactone decarboxylase
MERLALVGDDQPDPALGATYDFVRSRVGQVPNLYRTLAHAPNLLQGWIDFAWALRNDARTDRALRELVIMRTAQLNETNYEWTHHWKMAVAAGVSEDKLNALDGWRDSTLFSPAERVVLEMADQLAATTRLTDDAWQALAAMFDERQVVELVLTASFYACVSRVLGGLAVPLEEASSP